MIGVIGPARADNGIGTHLFCVFRQDFRIGIGQGKYDRLLRHGGYHFLAEHSPDRHTEKYIHTVDGLFKRSHIRIAGI